MTIRFNNGDISRILFINRRDDWEFKKGKLKGITIPQLVKKCGVKNTINFLLEIQKHEECSPIERIQISEVIDEIKRIEKIDFI